tara:strand:- start:1639 stop:1881 length:243 start_codon:yes stop_codon:yes gene_type:complete
MKAGDLIKRKDPESGWIPNPDVFGEDYYTALGIVTSLADDYCFAFFNNGTITVSQTGMGKSAGKIIKIRCDRVELINESR